MLHGPLLFVFYLVLIHTTKQLIMLKSIPVMLMADSVSILCGGIKNGGLWSHPSFADIVSVVSNDVAERN